MIHGKVTLKDKRNVARILSARAGAYDRLTPEALDTAANMTDEQIKDFLSAETEPEKLAPESVDVLKPGKTLPTDAEKLAEIVGGLADAYILKNNWEPEKISPLQWGAVCLTVGNFFRARSAFRGMPINPDTNKGIRERNAAESINAAAVADIIPLFLNLCYKYNKTPLICNFTDFCGLENDFLYTKTGPELTSERIGLKKKLEQMQADGLRMRTMDPKASPVGAIFLLKADHGLIEATKTIHEYERTGETAAALPVFGSDALLLSENDENGEK